MPTIILEKIKQVEGRNYPLVDASDVEMPDGTRLDATVQQAGEALAAAENRLDTLETPAESVDLTDFESDGTIIERRPDGSTVEQHMEFDENKVPVKIRHIVKNSDGEVVEENETSLIGFSEVGGGGGSGGIPPAYVERLNELETEVDGIHDAIEEMQGVAEGALGALSGIQQNVSQLGRTVEGVQQDVTELQTTVGGIQDSIEEMQSVAEGALGALAGVQEDIDELQQAAAPAKNVDLSKFESEGKIEQTAADGVTKLTYKFTFDAEGNPTKIVNPDGSETILTW